VIGLEEALVQAIMTNTFVKPEVRTEVREKLVTLQQEVPTYIQKVEEIVVPVFTEIQKGELS